MELTIAQRVSNGAEWLDNTVPGWEDRMTLPEFNIRNACKCVCGQVFKEDAAEHRAQSYNGFDYACDLYDGEYPWAQMSWAIYHGFDSPCDPDGVGIEYAALQDEWTAVIKERQECLVAV